MVDQTNGERYIAGHHPARNFEVRDSPLSEFGVLGFEYGYSIADPDLVLWEAQFGDFGNGAQVIIDQFIASGEAKWLRASGLVMLLPHGYEGQGPEHSSARLDRYLQLCAEDNIQVANCTTRGQLFPHPATAIALRDFRKPLIMMTPSRCCATSSRSRPSPSSPATATSAGSSATSVRPPRQDEGLVLCSGKLSYELMETRDKAGDQDTEIVRIEQLYPFPSEPLVKRLKAMPKLTDVVWAQEEPKNNGAWQFVENLLESCLVEAGFKDMRPRYAGRDASASPATGLAKRHAAEQAKLIADALGHGQTAATRAKAS